MRKELHNVISDIDKAVDKIGQHCVQIISEKTSLCGCYIILIKNLCRLNVLVAQYVEILI